MQGFKIAAMGITLDSPVAYANLGLASDSPNLLVYCNDFPGGGALTYSDGVAWRAFARGAQSKTLTTSASTGLASWTFEQPPTVEPAVSLSKKYSGSDFIDIDYSLTSDWKTITVRARKLVLNLGVLTASTPVAIQISILAIPPTSA